MKFTFNWLRQYIDPEMAPAQVAHRLTMLGLEVDACEPCYPDLNGVYVGRIEAMCSHANADKLNICDVRVGEELLRVVCGAPNARPGLVTAIALPGTVLPGGLVIRAAKIRGEQSGGMLCSARELGIPDDQDGIMELADDLVPGQSLVEALGLDDTLIEVDLTPNRPDCASVLGIAREVGGMVNRRIRPPVQSAPVLDGVDLPFSVAVESAEDSPRYSARLLKGVTVGTSPWWLRQRLLAVGLRPINNVVDISNFVMLEYGQPLHAFDFSKLAGGRVEVRRGRFGEKIVTLDNVERGLDERTLLICDAEKPVAIAGIMGGANSEVSIATTDILLESACFDAIGIRRTAGRLKMNTEASYRFERGTDPLAVPLAMERAVRLIEEICGGAVVAGGIDCRDGVREPAPIRLRTARTNSLLGMNLSTLQIVEALARIEICAEKTAADTLDTLLVVPPSFRVDLEREADLIEEVARLIGYDQVPISLPLVPMSFSRQDTVRTLRKKAEQIFTALGFFQAINYSFVSPRHNDLLALSSDDPCRQTVHLLNPLAEDQSVLRTSLLPGLLENLRRNVNHQNHDVRLFEVGKVFHPTGEGQPQEPFRLAAVLSGRRHPFSPALYAGEDTADIFDAKGVVEQLLAGLYLAAPVSQGQAVSSTPSFAEPGSVLDFFAGGEKIGCCGVFARNILRSFGIKQPACYIDLDLGSLAAVVPAAKRFSPLPKLPFVRWDLAVIVPETVAVGQMLAAIHDCGETIVEGAELFDVFKGKNIEAGKKSVAVAITYRDLDRTLDDETVGKVHQKITDMMISRFNGKLREA
jgi:phenylalanyl-tRNA synthetase beta chain